MRDKRHERIGGLLFAVALLIAAPNAMAKNPAAKARPTTTTRSKARSQSSLSAKRAATPRYKRVQRMIFRGSDVEAGVQRPDGGVITDRPPARMGTMNLVRATFLRELVKSGEDI